MPAAEPKPLEMIDAAVAPSHAFSHPVIEEVNWSVEEGECWVVGGLPGTGKSDLMAAAAGMHRLSRGTHRLFGRDLAALPEEERVHIRLRVGLVFGNEGRLFRHLTIAENLSLPFSYHSNCEPEEAEGHIRAVLEATGLASIATRHPTSINRNLRPRAALARALMLRPDLLLLDDPLRGLDLRETRWWMDFLRQLREGHPIMHRKRVTLGVATDDFIPWLGQGDKFALIENGRWLFLGGAEDLQKREEPLLREMLEARRR